VAPATLVPRVIAFVLLDPSCHPLHCFPCRNEVAARTALALSFAPGLLPAQSLVDRCEQRRSVDGLAEKSPDVLGGRAIAPAGLGVTGDKEYRQIGPIFLHGVKEIK